MLLKSIINSVKKILPAFKTSFCQQCRVIIFHGFLRAGLVSHGLPGQLRSHCHELCSLINNPTI